VSGVVPKQKLGGLLAKKPHSRRGNKEGRRGVGIGLLGSSTFQGEVRVGQNRYSVDIKIHSGACATLPGGEGAQGSPDGNRP